MRKTSFKIILSKPIPPEGRIPTAAEIKQFLSYGTIVQPNAKGSWLLRWNQLSRGDNGEKKPYLFHYNKKSRVRDGWEFAAIEAEPKPKKEPKAKKLPAPLPLLRPKATSIVWDF